MARPPQMNTQLTPWHQKQAAMLTYFSSLDYLTELRNLVTRVISGVNPVLDDSKKQNRDALLLSSRWGSRHTSENWSNYGWPFFKDLQLALGRDTVLRASGIYQTTAVNECLRGAEQFSLAWMTPGEEMLFTQAVQDINDWAAPLDLTMPNWMSRGWDDYLFAYYYPAFASRCKVASRYRILTDVAYPTGKVPPQTGIYVSRDDPYAALQFATSGRKGSALCPANTFNDLGLAALNDVGRNDLWFDEQKMFDFAYASRFAPTLRDEVIFDGRPCPDLARSAVARKAFQTRDSEWCLIEPIQGQLDPLADLITETPSTEGVSIAGGETIREPGYYFSPSHPNSRRYFSSGDTAPVFEAHYGQTFWQRDLNQEQT